MLVFTVAAVFVAIKRSILAALVYGLEKVRLGERTMKLSSNASWRSTRKEHTASAEPWWRGRPERLPLATAETRLRAATDALLRDDPSLGFFKRRVRAAAR